MSGLFRLFRSWIKPGCNTCNIPRYSSPRRRASMWDGVGVVKIVFTSPYHRFCQATRPTLPTSLKNSERERLLGEMWKSLSKDGREAFKSGLVQQLNTGRGGIRAWQPAFDCSGTSPAAALDAWQPVLDPPAKRRATAEGAVRVGGYEHELCVDCERVS